MILPARNLRSSVLVPEEKEKEGVNCTLRGSKKGSVGSGAWGRIRSLARKAGGRFDENADGEGDGRCWSLIVVDLVVDLVVVTFASCALTEKRRWCCRWRRDGAFLDL